MSGGIGGISVAIIELEVSVCVSRLFYHHEHLRHCVADVHDTTDGSREEGAGVDFNHVEALIGDSGTVEHIL